jgi:hypothetical protein
MLLLEIRSRIPYAVRMEFMWNGIQKLIDLQDPMDYCQKVRGTNQIKDFDNSP